MPDEIEFISYTGAYPCLCTGVLTLKINGKIRNDFHLYSGGSVSFDNDWNEYVEQGEWGVGVPDDLKHLQSEIEGIVNKNVPHGCCGGCV